MIDDGASPFVFDYCDKTQLDDYNLRHLKNIPDKKSVYFTTRPIIDEKGEISFCDPWFYRIGIYNGKFNLSAAIGKGASGIVISGQ